MNRRSFLGLLLATPWVPALAKLEPIIQAPAPVLAEPELGWVVERYIVSLCTNVVQPGRIDRCSFTISNAFRPDRLLIGSQSAEFDLLHVAMSGEPQLDCEAIPAEIFDPRGYGMYMKFATVAPGDEIVLCVRNRGRTPNAFLASFIGSTSRPKTQDDVERERAHARLYALDWEKTRKHDERIAKKFSRMRALRKS